MRIDDIWEGCKVLGSPGLISASGFNASRTLKKYDQIWKYTQYTAPISLDKVATVDRRHNLVYNYPLSPYLCIFRPLMLHAYIELQPSSRYQEWYIYHNYIYHEDILVTEIHQIFSSNNIPSSMKWELTSVKQALALLAMSNWIFWVNEGIIILLVHL